MRNLQDRFTGSEAQLREAEIQLGFTEIRAPFDGVVSRTWVNTGDLAAPGQPLVEVEGIGDFEIEAAVPESLAAALTPGASLACDVAGTRFSVAQRDSSLPTLEPGESAWTYDVMSRSELTAFLGPWPELAAYAQSADPVPKAPSADIELRWDESVPASLALRVPADRVPAAFAGDLGAFVRGLEWALAYGRAAGIRSRVELALPHVHERLLLRDELTLRAAAGFREAAPIQESAPPPTPGIGLTDTLKPPTDALSFGGLFDTTPFDTSLFF